jgi:hypothetical protein
MMKKQRHCVPTWKMPRSPAKQARPLTSLQQVTSCKLCCCDTTFAKADEPEVVPSRTKYGEMPKELLKEMMR